jgi:hypothetical protein
VTSVAWDEHQDQQWLRRVVTELPREDEDDAVRFHGPCPRCGDDITVEIPRPPEFDVGWAERAEEPAPAPEPDETARRRCNCTSEHEGRPKDRSGCGVWGFAWSD